MRFEPGWDTLLLAGWLQCQDSRALLTAYPAGYSPDGEQETGVFYGMAAKGFDDQGILLFCGSPRYVQNDSSAPLKPFPGAIH